MGAARGWREGLEKGKLLFELKGYKLHGKWTLVKIKKSEKDWLLIKERDAWMKSPGDSVSRRVGAVGPHGRRGKGRARRRARDCARRSSRKTRRCRGRVDPTTVEPMLGEPADEAFTRDGWMFELKLDGYRLLASKSKGEALLLTRNGNDYTGVSGDRARDEGAAVR